jgi:hypothetical protein
MIGNILIITWFAICLLEVILVTIYGKSSKDYSKTRIQILETVIAIIYAIIPFEILIGLFLSFLGI